MVALSAESLDTCPGNVPKEDQVEVEVVKVEEAVEDAIIADKVATCLENVVNQNDDRRYIFCDMILYNRAGLKYFSPIFSSLCIVKIVI